MAKTAKLTNIFFPSYLNWYLNWFLIPEHFDTHCKNQVASKEIEEKKKKEENAMAGFMKKWTDKCIPSSSSKDSTQGTATPDASDDDMREEDNEDERENE